MKPFSKADIARIARKLWRYEGDRREGRDTVRAVLTVAGFKVEPHARRKPTR